MTTTESKTSITLAGAAPVAAAAESYAQGKGWAVTICVADAAGVPLIVRRSGGAFPASVQLAIGKASSCIGFGRPTGKLEDMINNGRTAFVGAAGGTSLRGGVPIEQNGSVIGSVGVSGLTPDQDEEVANAGVAAIQ